MKTGSDSVADHTRAAREILEQISREEWKALVGQLCGIFGFTKRDQVQDMLQDAMVKALERWSSEGLPRNPQAWLIAVARNQMLDALRRHSMQQRKESDILQFLDSEPAAVADHFESSAEELLRDESLRTLFICCDPELTEASRLALILKNFCAYTAAEVGQVLGTAEAAAAKRITRAVATLQRSTSARSLDSVAIHERLPWVLLGLMRIFEQGLYPVKGEEFIQLQHCQEALFHSIRLLRHPLTARADTQALIAYMLLSSARIPALDAENSLAPLGGRDRSYWNEQMLNRGLHYFALASRSQAQGEIYWRAAIAASQAIAPAHEETDWQQILTLFAKLRSLHNYWIYRLESLQALAFARGAPAALASTETGNEQEGYGGQLRLQTLRADLHADAGDNEAAAKFYRQLATGSSAAYLRRHATSQLDQLRVTS